MVSEQKPSERACMDWLDSFQTCPEAKAIFAAGWNAAIDAALECMEPSTRDWDGKAIEKLKG